MKPFRELTSIAIITMLAHVVGSAILATWTGGLAMLLAGPILAFFDWFMLIPEFAIVAAQWELAKRDRLSKLYSWMLTVLLTSIVFALVGPKEEGKAILWMFGYAIGSLVAFSISLAIIYRHHNLEADSAEN